MKGKTKSILGVTLTLMLMVSLLLWAAPVSAKDLKWGAEDIPDTDGKVLLAGTDISDFAVADGEVIYAVAGGIASLTMGGSGDGVAASWSTDNELAGSYSAKLIGGDQDGSTYAAVVIPIGGAVKLSEVTEFVFKYTFATAGNWGPHMCFYTHDPNDGETGEITLYSGGGGGAGYTGTPASQGLNTVTLVPATKGFFFYGTESEATSTITEALPNVYTLAEFQAATGFVDHVIDRIQIEYGWWGAGDANEPAYLDYVSLNGNLYDMEPGELYRSTNAGESWSGLTEPDDAASVQLVAVAPDDAYFIAIVADDDEVYISEDAGQEWDDLGTVTETTNILTDIKALAVSQESGGKHYVAVAGIDDDSSEANVFYFDVGAAVPVWTETKDLGGFYEGDVASAVEFSPNFVSDKVMLAISAKTSSTFKIKFNIFSYSSKDWNSNAGFGTGYPVDLTYSGESVTAVGSASISPDPEFLGSDDAMRIAFVGLAVDAGLDTSGIWRLDDDDLDEVKKGVEIHSVAFDGTNLVAGQYDSNTVRRSADPLSTEPSVKSSSSLKSPGGQTRTVVAWAGDDVVAGTTGDESAFAVSRDNGKTFNDISLIDTALSTLSDVAVAPDGSKVYLVTDDGEDLSLWRLADDAWERVLNVQGSSDFIVRLAPDDIDVVYVAEKTAEKIYYSGDGGETRWQTRSCKVNIQDLAVETDGEVLYAINTSGSVSKSTNRGFTWATSVTAKISGNTLISLGEDLLLVGSKAGSCSYSTDGNTTWSKLEDGMETGNVVAIATGLDDGDFVFAGLNDCKYIYRWEIGEDDEWGDIHDSVGTGTDDVTGIALVAGVLYAVANDGTGSTLYHSLNPTADTPTFSEETTGGDAVVFGATPSALRASSGTELWAIATDEGKLMTYNDTVSVAGPELSSPGDDFANEVNPITGKASDLTFSFVCPSDRVTSFDIEISLDSSFDDLVIDNSVTGTPEEGDRIWQMIGPNGASDWVVEWTPETTYYWHARVSKDGPIRGPWSETRTITIGEAVAVPPVEIEIPPAPEITVEMPAPEVTVTVPPMVQVPPAPAPVAPAYIWGVIVIGALLVVALIVLIFRTRRVV